MTAHAHRSYVAGCFRCELSRDEVMNNAHDACAAGDHTYRKTYTDSIPRCVCGKVEPSHCPEQAESAPDVRSVPLSWVLKNYRDGDSVGWPAEFAFLRSFDFKRMAFLTVDIATTGQRDPITLGVDGRVWDGHHRLCVLDALRSSNEEDPAVLVTDVRPSTTEDSLNRMDES